MGQLRSRVEAYFQSCNSGAPDAIAAHFTADACIYDLNVKPVCGRDAIGRFWAQICAKWDGPRWTIDSLVEDEAADAVAMEWSMTGRRDGVPFRVSGADHYSFKGGLISEVRQYWIFDPARLDRRLVGYPYEPSAAAPAA